MSSYVRVSMTLPAPLHEDVQQILTEEHMTMSEFMRTAIRTYLGQASLKRAHGLGDDLAHRPERRHTPVLTGDHEEKDVQAPEPEHVAH